MYQEIFILYRGPTADCCVGTCNKLYLLKMMRAISQSQSTDNSYAFFIKPNFRFVNVTLIYCYPTVQNVTYPEIINLFPKKVR